MLGILWFVITFAAWMCLVYLFLVIIHVGTRVGVKIEAETPDNKASERERK